MIKLFVIMLFSSVMIARSQESAFPFSFKTTERTENLPAYVTPPLPNLYNDKPDFKVGWGIDYPIGTVIIDNETWVMFNSGNQYGRTVKVARFKGTDFENTTRQPDGSINVEKDVSTHFLGGMWNDKSAGILYAPIHCEYKRDITPAAGWSRKKTRLAASTDKGLTWKMKGDIVTNFMSEDDDWLKFSGSHFEAGPGDFDFFIDSPGGYFYIISGNAYAPKNGKINNYLWFNEAVRCAIKDKMMPGKWFKFHNGKWTEPGLGGKSSKIAMNSYGIYGRIIYSAFLKKYLRIGPCLGVADRRFTDLGFKDASIFISTCDDLEKQIWSPKVKLFSIPDNDKYGITLTDGNARDPFICGNTLRIYNYWLYNIPSRAIDVTFAEGNSETAGFPKYGSYAYEPLPESGDSLVNRKTRIVGCSKPENIYIGGAWVIKNDPKYYRTEIKECSLPGSSLQFTFKGSDIYWRAVADSDCGKADVYIDNKFQETVDCYFKESLPFQFAFIKKGLDAKTTHTIKIIIRNDKNILSGGTAIRHMAFEYAAESYNASAGFSSISGKNNWFYQKGENSKFSDLYFLSSEKISVGSGETIKEKFIYPNYYGKKGISIVGNSYQIPGKMDAVRTFIAPHSGRIRIEGYIEIDKDTNTTYTIQIMKNNGNILLEKEVEYYGPATHDMVIPVNKSDAIHFIIKKKDEQNTIKAMWDPTVTFLN